MYLIGLSLLVAAASVSGHPSCDEGMEKCLKGKKVPEPFPITAESLDELCPFAISVLDCQIDYSKRCESKYFSKEALEEYRKLYGMLCSSTDLRQKYLNIIKCALSTKESAKECGSKDKDPCKAVKNSIGCGRRLVVEACGNEAGELYDALLEPMKVEMRKHGCKEVKMFGMGAFIF